MKICRPLPGLHPKTVSSRRENATSHARAALAVSHDCDGLLRLIPCRFVAPCNRSWGSLRFQRACPTPAIVRCRAVPLPRACSPSSQCPTLRSLSLVTSAALRHHSRYLLAVTAGSSCLHASVATCSPTTLPRLPDLKVLFRCRVRCSHQVLPPGRCSMLPWACLPQSNWSLHAPRRSSCGFPAPGSPAHRVSRDSQCAIEPFRRLACCSWSALPPKRDVLAMKPRPASLCIDQRRWFLHRGVGRVQVPTEAVASLLPGLGAARVNRSGLLRCPGGSRPGSDRSRCLSASRGELLFELPAESRSFFKSLGGSLDAEVLTRRPSSCRDRRVRIRVGRHRTTRAIAACAVAGRPGARTLNLRAPGDGRLSGRWR
jgi:hypothetical protein